jgi:hypothetical protein
VPGGITGPPSPWGWVINTGTWPSRLEESHDRKLRSRVMRDSELESDCAGKAEKQFYK